MNKKIKIIELLNKIANGEKLPKKIKWGTINYILKQDSLDGHLYYEKEQEWASLVGELKTMNDLKSEVEILEDNTEEIEELKKEQQAIENPKTRMQEIRFYYDADKMGDKINELVKAVNQMRKEKEYCCNCGAELTNENKALPNMCNECKYGIDWEERSK